MTIQAVEMASYLSKILKQNNFDYFGVTHPKSHPTDQKNYDQWVEFGKHGSMEYLRKHRSLKLRPDKMLADCSSVIIVALNYYRESSSTKKSQGRIARYAHGRDYHKVLGNKLKSVCKQLKELYPAESFYSNTDASPLLERVYAREAGLGFIGKNTMLITKQFGSWVLLGEILTSLKLPEVPATTLKQGSCGTCTRCQDICPTGALDNEYSIDATKCISYLTIEHRGSIPVELRQKMGNWLFGCDLCQEVCPHNARASSTNEPDFVKSYAGDSRELKEILEMETDEQFLQKFAGSPVMRAKRTGLIRNACIVAANNKCTDLIPQLKKLSEDTDPIIAEHAQWALTELT
jgi:epoxyqueuosine reductase